MTKAVFQLEQVTCPSCIKKIETTLKKIVGVEDAEVLFNLSRVRAQFDEDKNYKNKHYEINFGSYGSNGNYDNASTDNQCTL